MILVYVLSSTSSRNWHLMGVWSQLFSDCFEVLLLDLNWIQFNLLNLQNRDLQKYSGQHSKTKSHIFHSSLKQLFSHRMQIWQLSSFLNTLPPYISQLLNGMPSVLGLNPTRDIDRWWNSNNVIIMMQCSRIWFVY